jgi:hypothetical protein
VQVGHHAAARAAAQPMLQPAVDLRRRFGAAQFRSGRFRFQSCLPDPIHYTLRMSARTGQTIKATGRPVRSIRLRRAAACLALIFPGLLYASPARALPSFAQQTGQPCAACHVGAFGRQLKPYRREFKLYGCGSLSLISAGPSRYYLDRRYEAVEQKLAG